MEGQDEMDDILVESYPTNIKRTFGGLSMNGCYKMNESYGTDGNDMTDTWTIFGDPSVMVRTDMPQEITATHDSQVFIGATSFTVSSPVEGALVALSVDSQFVASGFITNGTVTLDFPAFQAPDTINLRMPGEAADGVSGHIIEINCGIARTQLEGCVHLRLRLILAGEIYCGVFAGFQRALRKAPFERIGLKVRQAVIPQVDVLIAGVIKLRPRVAIGRSWEHFAQYKFGRR